MDGQHRDVVIGGCAGQEVVAQRFDEVAYVGSDAGDKITEIVSQVRAAAFDQPSV